MRWNPWLSDVGYFKNLNDKYDEKNASMMNGGEGKVINMKI